MRNTLFACLLPLAMVSAAPAGTAMVAPFNTPPKATLKLTSTTVKPNDLIKGSVTLTFAPGLHGYQNPPSLDYQIPVTIKVSGKDFTAMKVKYPEGKDFRMEGEAVPSKVYEDVVEFPFEVRAPKKSGTFELPIRVDYQQCDESSCFPPGVVQLKVKVQVKSSK